MSSKIAKFQDCLYEEDQNIHLNAKFPITIANISLEKQNILGMRLPNSTFYPIQCPCMNSCDCDWLNLGKLSKKREQMLKMFPFPMIDSLNFYQVRNCLNRGSNFSQRQPISYLKMSTKSPAVSVAAGNHFAAGERRSGRWPLFFKVYYKFIIFSCFYCTTHSTYRPGHLHQVYS